MIQPMWNIVLTKIIFIMVMAVAVAPIIECERASKLG